MKMMRAALILLLLVLLAGVGACERPGSDRSPAAGPTQPAAAAPEVPPLPPLSFIAVNQQLYEFPRARLRVQRKDDLVLALLFSDDPANREDEAHTGHSFYFEMRLDIDDPADLSDVLWTWQAASAERAESPNGIFLNGWRQHLQPMDVEAAFEPHPDLPDRLVIHLAGRFLMFHTRDRTQGPVWAAVDGRLIVQPELAK
jgi:hypothetical protein